MAPVWPRPWMRPALEWGWAAAVLVAALGGLPAWSVLALPLYPLTWRWHCAVAGRRVDRAYELGLAAWAAAWGVALGSVAVSGGRAGVAVELARGAALGLAPVAASVALLVVVHTRRLPSRAAQRGAAADGA
jgi:hypothetical protein